MFLLNIKVYFAVISLWSPVCRWVSRVDKLQAVWCITSCISAAMKRARSCVTSFEPHDARSVQHALVHTLTPWHVLTNPSLTPLCSITLDNRTINDHCADLRGQPALAASDGIFPFLSMEGHIGFYILLHVSRLFYSTPGNLCNIHSATRKLIVSSGLRQLEIWMFEDNMVQKRGCGYHFNYGWAD